MTLEKIDRRGEPEHFDFLLTCDHPDCKSALDIRDRTFFQAVAYLKAKGWVAGKIYGSWRHSCPACQKRPTTLLRKLPND